MTATVLAVLSLMLLAGALVLSALTGQLSVLGSGPIVPVAVVYAAVGFIVARRQPGNPIGWILITFIAVFLLSGAAGGYAALYYRFGHHGLPLAPVAVVLGPLWAPALLLFPAILAGIGVLVVAPQVVPEDWVAAGGGGGAAAIFLVAVVFIVGGMFYAVRAERWRRVLSRYEWREVSYSYSEREERTYSGRGSWTSWGAGPYRTHCRGARRDRAIEPLRRGNPLGLVAAAGMAAGSHRGRMARW